LRMVAALIFSRLDLATVREPTGELDNTWW